MNEKNYQMIAFTEDGLSLDVRVDTEKDTVGLRLRNICFEGELEITTYEESSVVRFEGNPQVKRTRITRHLSNIYKDGELDKSATCAESAQIQKEGTRTVARQVPLYNLEAIILVGYRVNSKRGIAFRRRANTVLKYLIEGYAKNEKRLAALHRTLEVQRALLTHYAEGAGVDADEVIAVLDRYTSAFNMLNDDEAMPRAMCGKRTLQTPIVRRLFCALINGRPISKNCN